MILHFLLHSFNGLFFQDNLGNLAAEKQNHSCKTNLDLLEQETVSGSGISWAICNAYSLRPPAKSPPAWRHTGSPHP